MSELPPLSTLAKDPQALANALALLFEPSPVLHDTLVPQLSSSLASQNVDSYEELIERALAIIHAWPHAQQAAFVGAHPRIGEVRGLSALSAAEQTRVATLQAVLDRLRVLNEMYERRFVGLRYITFVNGRSRMEVAAEFEERMNAWPEGAETGQGGELWTKELDRAVDEVGLIALSRLKVLLQ